MTVQLLAHPFRLGDDGGMKTHEQDSEPYLAERIALILGCRPGERPLVPTFGVSDPTFDGMELVAIQNQITIFEIPVTITGLDRDDTSYSTSTYQVTFERTEPQEQDA